MSDIRIFDCKKRSSKTHQRICYGEEFSEYMEWVNSCCCWQLKGQVGVCDLRKGACKVWQTVTQNCAWICNGTKLLFREIFTLVGC